MPPDRRITRTPRTAGTAGPQDPITEFSNRDPRHKGTPDFGAATGAAIAARGRCPAAAHHQPARSGGPDSPQNNEEKVVARLDRALTDRVDKDKVRGGRPLAAETSGQSPTPNHCHYTCAEHCHVACAHTPSGVSALPDRSGNPAFVCGSVITRFPGHATTTSDQSAPARCRRELVHAGFVARRLS